VNAFPGIAFDQPVGVASPPGETNRLFVVQKNGLICVITNLAAPTRSTFLDITDRVRTVNIESGLLGLAFHPGYATNGFFYVYLTAIASSPGAPNRYHDVVARFSVSTADPNKANPNSELPLILHYDESDSHNAGGMRFGPDGYLYIAVGDVINRDPAWQDQAPIDRDLHGAILRIDVDRRPGNLAPNPHPASTTNYSIPADNPFVGARSYHGYAVDPAQVRTELYAVGLRNPWQMNFDPVTGELFMGDVGDSRQEELNRIVRGGDYGWPYLEGTLPTRYSPPPEFNPLPPIHTYTHGWSGGTNGDCVIGGLIYRGRAMPWLQGRLVFGDYRTGYLWALNVLDPGAPVETLGGGTTLGITSFGVDPRDGEVLLTKIFEGTIQRLIYVPPEQVQDLPPTLAETGLFADLASLTPNPGFVPYEVNVSFWSDEARKSRWFCIPELGPTIGYSSDAWSFPTGAVWVKHFDMQMTNGVASSIRRLETRVLMNTAEGFYGLTYRWGASLTNAMLVPAEGAQEVLSIRNPDGSLLREQSWHYPSRAECLDCHSSWGGRVLGFSPAQLNRTVNYGGFATNQIRALANAGYMNPVPPANAEWPALAPATALDRPLEFRVRSYFQANCSMCHTPGAYSGTVWDARIATPLASAHLLGEVILPGQPDASLLYLRLQGYQRLMPPIGATMQNSTALDLLADWIAHLPQAPWSYQSIGDVVHNGGSTVSNGVYTVSGTGVSLQGTMDAFQFLHESSTDHSVHYLARLVSNDSTNPAAMAGLMIRDGAGVNDRFLMAGWRGDQTVALLRRDQAGGPVSATSFPGVTLPQWLRCVRQEDRLEGWRSADGTNWISLGTAALANSESLEIGFAVNSGSRTEFNNARFDNFSSLSVALTSAVPARVEQPGTVTLGVRVVASGRNVAQVEYYDGDVKLGQTLGDPHVLIVSNLWVGPHLLKARAVDSAGTFVETPSRQVDVDPSPTRAGIVSVTPRQEGSGWPGSGSGNGYAIIALDTNLPPFIDLSFVGVQERLWEDNSRDPRALSKPGTDYGVAAAWESSPPFSLSLVLRNGASQLVRLYFIDWDTADERVQQVDFVEPGTGRVVASQTISGFSEGIFVAAFVRGSVQIRVTSLNGHSAVMSGVFFEDYAPVLPDVTLTRPLPGTSVELPAVLQLQAELSGPTGTVEGVGFYVDGTQVSFQTNAPFVAQFSDPPEGVRTLVARVFDPSGASRDSAPVTVTVHLPRAKALFLGEDSITRGDWITRYGSSGAFLPPILTSWPATFPQELVGASYYPLYGSDPNFLEVPDSPWRVWPLLYGYSSIIYNVGLADGRPWQVAIYVYDDSIYPEIVTVSDSVRDMVLDTQTVTNGSGGRYLVWNMEGKVAIQIRNPAPGAVQSRVAGLFLDPFTNPPPEVRLIAPAGDIELGAPARVLLSAIATSADGIREVEFRTPDVKLGRVGQLPYDFLWEYPAAGVHQVFARAITTAGAVHDSLPVTIAITSSAPTSVRFLGADTQTKGNWLTQYGVEAYLLPGNPGYSKVPASVQFLIDVDWAQYSSQALVAEPRIPTGAGRILSFWVAQDLRWQTRLTDGRAHRVSLYNYAPGWGNQILVSVRAPDSETVLDQRSIPAQFQGTYLTWEIQGNASFQIIGDWAFLNALFVDPVPDPFGDWQRSQFPAAELANPALIAERADPDADGYDNWSEYLLGRDPRHRDAQSPLWLEPDGGGARLHLLVAKPFGEEQVGLQSSLDLHAWTDGPDLGPVQQVDRGDHSELIYRLTPPVGRPVFFRLRLNGP
jgi:glucose/arabinose dehydrogenase